MPPPPKRRRKRQARVDDDVDVSDLKENLAYYEARCAELHELVADLAIENVRLRRAAGAGDDG